MRIGLLGGLRLEHDGHPVSVVGAMQQAVLVRLALDAGRIVAYRAIVEDVWGLDAPENERAALQSVVSRLRAQLPAGVVESAPGGYRLAVDRGAVDVLALEARARRILQSKDADGAAALLSEQDADAEVWLPSDRFDWVATDLAHDRAALAELASQRRADDARVAPGPPESGARTPPAAGTVADGREGGNGSAGSRTRAHSIPAPLTALIGRADELAAIDAQLERARLVTVLGPGGAGKTRIAIETGRARPGAVLVELAPAGPTEVLSALLSATGRDLRAEAGETVSTRDRVLDALAGRDILLVLDNCEHVIGEAAAVVADLLGALPRLRVLATSREPLGVPGEAFVPLGPLAHPAQVAAASAESRADLASYPAVELFLERASAATGAPFDDVETASTICARLDGLPLALELAAAKLRTMTAAEVLDGLENRFALLTGGGRTVLPRHQTLRAMIDWSWSLIGEEERRALAWIAVYPAGIAVRDAPGLAAEAATVATPRAGTDAADAAVSAETLEALVDRSLLQRVRGRYRALETIREYGIEQLAARGELAAARESQARRMARSAGAADVLLRGPRIHDGIAWFDAEEDNLAAALRYAVAAPLPEAAVDLALASAWYWIVRDRSEDARSWFPPVAELATRVDSPGGRMLALLGPLATMLAQTDDIDRRRQSDDGGPARATRDAREPGGTRGPQWSDADAVAHPSQPVPPPAAPGAAPGPAAPGDALALRDSDPIDLFREQLLAAEAGLDGVAGEDDGNDILQVIPPVLAAFAIAFGEDDWMLRLTIPSGEELGLRPWPTATLHVVASAIAQNRGDVEQLGLRSERAVDQFVAIGDLWGLALAQQMRAEWLLLQGRLEESLAMTDASTENMSRITTSWDLAQQQGLAIDILSRLGRNAEAEERVQAMLAAAERQGSVRAAMVARSTAAQLHVRLGDADAASADLAAVGDIAADFGDAVNQITATRDVHAAGIATLQRRFDDAEELLRSACAAAVASHDQPIMGTVALAAGALALHRGDLEQALEAVDVAAVLIGARDATHPQVVAIDRAAAAAGLRRTSTELTRPMAIAALERLAWSARSPVADTRP